MSRIENRSSPINKCACFIVASLSCRTVPLVCVEPSSFGSPLTRDSFAYFAEDTFVSIRLFLSQRDKGIGYRLTVN